MQCGEHVVQLEEEVALEDIRIEGLDGSVVDAADVADGAPDRLGDLHGALQLVVPVELIGDLIGVEPPVITVHDGLEARSTGHDGLDDAAAGQLAIPAVDATSIFLDSQELVAVAHVMELLIALQVMEDRFTRVVRGKHDRRQAVGEHRHEDALLAVDHHGKDAGVGHVLAQEASKAVADLDCLRHLRTSPNTFAHPCLLIWTGSGLTTWDTHV